MKIRSALAVAAAVLVSACGKDKCPTESPEVTAVGTCTAPPAVSITYPIRLCPTCNQVFTACDAQISGGTIFLDPRVEVCTSAASCPAACNAAVNGCAFVTPPTGTYLVQAYDPAHPAVPRTGTLDVVAASGVSCAPL